MSTMLQGIRGDDAVPLKKPDNITEWYLLASSMKSKFPNIWTEIKITEMDKADMQRKKPPETKYVMNLLDLGYATESGYGSEESVEIERVI